MDGFTVTRRLREKGQHTPVLFLTARDDTADKVQGLTVGGDDYVTKPFSLEEVVARIRAILRRTGPDRDDDARILRYADLELDDDSHEVRRAGHEIDLSPTEFKLLRYLMLNPGRVLSKAQILDHVWQYDWGGDANIVESYISYLRRKVDQVDDAAGTAAAPAHPHQARRGLPAARDGMTAGATRYASRQPAGRDRPTLRRRARARWAGVPLVGAPDRHHDRAARRRAARRRRGRGDDPARAQPGGPGGRQARRPRASSVALSDRRRARAAASRSTSRTSRPTTTCASPARRPDAGAVDLPDDRERGVRHAERARRSPPPRPVARSGEPFTVSASTGRTRTWRVVGYPVRTSDGTVGVGRRRPAPRRHRATRSDDDPSCCCSAAGHRPASARSPARWAVRRSLRPLREIEATAAAIAAGDLSQRVPAAPASHRGRPAGRRAERHARPDRAGVRRAHRLRGAHAPLRRRRLARAADARSRRSAATASCTGWAR